MIVDSRKAFFVLSFAPWILLIGSVIISALVTPSGSESGGWFIFLFAIPFSFFLSLILAIAGTIFSIRALIHKENAIRLITATLIAGSPVLIIFLPLLVVDYKDAFGLFGFMGKLLFRQ